MQIDDNEMAYLQLIMDEIFGRKNRVNTICVKMSEASGCRNVSRKKALAQGEGIYIVLPKKRGFEILPETLSIPLKKFEIMNTNSFRKVHEGNASTTQRDTQTNIS